MKYAHQIASYEMVKIVTAYLNGVKVQFGNKVRMFLNLLLKKNERIKALKSEMKKNEGTEKEIVATIKTITEQISKVKLAISSRSIEDVPKEFFSSNDLDKIRNLFDSYSTDYRFAKGSIYYDCKANPLKHIKAYYRLSSMCEALQNKSFNCFPLRKGFIPSYMTIDTYILNTQILKNSIISHLDKEVVWGAVLDVRSKAMKPQGERRIMKFRGTIYTDGVGVSVLKQSYDTMKKGGSSGGKPKSIKAEEFQYIEKLGKEELLAGVGKCVLIDPGRRDLLYCMHEKSTVENKMIYRYTSNQKAIETKSRKFRKLRNNLKRDEVIAAELSLSHFKSSTVNKDKFIEYLQERAKVTHVMKAYYLNEDRPAAEDQGAGGFLPFRKMKFSSFINQQQADKRLAKKLRERFGNDSILILGNWSAGKVKYHEPIRGVGMRRMLAKEGFQVYLLDEFRTSSLCPSCQNGELETFKKVQNPRPYQREKYPVVDRHGLLRCKNQQCLKAVMSTIETTDKAPLRRLWNRDMAATLNFRQILFSLRANGERPERFCRSKKPLSTGSKRKDMSSPSASTSQPTKRQNNPL
ncbi:hypothetical protein G6F57_014079 [Rhizopus arrhizus]|uniref:Transposase n=1 Tax=Rhizopus oryzae TaxID=64495 RepID=A0A9P6WXF7_RHIOR|nr:hypothetical protein G6F24_012807 [Rhizopus arrhizus]KAG1397141.1 hypothetical protein G6F58_011582 [Rhizopus delemar]KAG0778400.1 hypothetical protein G6F22_011258 [Rhizopus arrhizus]KAG0804679.1 hypothetical protein G6F20_012507 [Rhizopus arrhizus]KAG0819385.1 hypothetical protein G6F19_012595 [Rhizopus arrhizus]